MEAIRRCGYKGKSRNPNRPAANNAHKDPPKDPANAGNTGAAFVARGNHDDVSDDGYSHDRT